MKLSPKKSKYFWIFCKGNTNVQKLVAAGWETGCLALSKCKVCSCSRGGPDLGKVAQEAAPEAAAWYQQQQQLWCSRRVQQKQQHEGCRRCRSSPGWRGSLGRYQAGLSLSYSKLLASLQQPTALAMLVLQNATQYNGGLKAMLAKISKDG